MEKECVRLAYAELTEYGYITERTQELLIGAGLDPIQVQCDWEDDPPRDEPLDPPGWEGGFADNH